MNLKLSHLWLVNAYLPRQLCFKTLINRWHCSCKPHPTQHNCAVSEEGRRVQASFKSVVSVSDTMPLE